MDYTFLKLIHQTAVVLSITGFIARGIGSFKGAEWVNTKLVKVLPHVIDTVLLLSAVALAWTLRLSPGNSPWITAKIVGLLVYIALGSIALKPRFGRPVRIGAWLAGLLVFAWIISVAITKSPAGFLRALGV